MHHQADLSRVSELCCSLTCNVLQSARGVVFAGFELKIDSMTAMQISGIDMDRLYNLSLAATTNQPVVSMVAFR